LNTKDALGRRGEQLAAQYLEQAGFRILDRNWRCAEGEIDIVAAERRVLVVCEVKTRSDTRYGSPLDAITRAKRSRLRRLAIRWLVAHDRTGHFTVEHVRGVG
jgi:putative endonuclease